jgi:hypothetical protein
MSPSPLKRFAIVGCPSCRSLWIIADRHQQETTSCPLCGSVHAVEKLRAHFQHDDIDVVCEIRSKILAQNAGCEERYEEVDDYAILEEHADEYLARYDELGEVRAEDYLDEQELLYEDQAETYLDDQELLYEKQAEAYLDRQQQELNQWVEDSVQTPETDAIDTDPSPFTEQVDPSHPDGAGITLTTPETLPEPADVRLIDPPVAPTKLWKRLWQTGNLVDRLRDALDTLRGASYLEAWATLTEAGGVTAPATADHPAYVEFILDALKHSPTDEEWAAIVRLTRQLGGTTALGQTERADIINGAIALFAACEVTPQVTIRLTHDLFEAHQRNQRERFLRFLTDVSVAFDVRIECAGRILPKKLASQHNEELPDGCLTEAPQAYHLDPNRPTGSPERVAERALDEFGYEHEYYEVLDALAATPSHRRRFAALREDSTFDVSSNGVQKRVDRLREFNLVSIDQLNTDAFVQLLPAGEELLTLREQERHAQARLDKYTTVSAADQPAENATECDVTDPPKSPDKSVCSAHAREGGKGPADDASMDRSATTAAVDDDAAPNSRSFWLPPAHQHAVVAACTGDNGGPDIALADESAPTREQPRDCLVGYDKGRKEVVLSIQPSPIAAYTMTRVCTGLLGPLLRNTILTAADLDGKDGEPLGKLLEAGVSTTALRNIHQLGCLPEQSATGDGYRKELTDEYVGIIEDVPKIKSGEEFESSLARSVCQRAHGLAGTAMRIYELLGWDVSQEWTFPDRSSISRPERRRIYQKTLAKHIAVVSRYGGYPAHRILYEDDDEIRADSLGCPNVDAIDPTGACFGTWVLRGPGIDRWASDLTDLEAAGDLELQEGERNYTEFLVELSIGQATRKATVETAAERLCEMKDLRLTRSASALLAAFTDSVFSTAEALSGLATARDFERDISLDEVRFALSTLTPTAILLNLDTDGDDARRKNARSKIVHALLVAQETLTTGDVAERAGVSNQSIRNHRDALAAIGLLEIDARGVGKATYYRLTLPFRDERGDRDAPRPLFLPDGEGEESMYGVRDVVHELLEARGLLDEASADDAIDEGLMGWPPDLRPAVDRWPWLRPWIDTIVWLFGDEGGGSIAGPSKWIDGPFEVTARLGTEPETTQAHLPV